MPVTGEDWLQAQYSVIGSALIDNAVVPKVMAETSPRDFNGPCLTIYNAIRKVFLSGAVVDPVSVGDVVGPQYREFMMQVMEITPTAARIDQYIQLCREQARVFAIQNIAQRMATTDNSDSLRKLLEEAAGLMVDRPSLKITTMAEALRSFMERHKPGAETHYLSWPIHELNSASFGAFAMALFIGANMNGRNTE